uniref:small monomeric GTPase n=1 Tax=Oncorhynchus tshawytscha TaxID=74940 RepID=A0A8C8F5X2_ONCTS
MYTDTPKNNLSRTLKYFLLKYITPLHFTSTLHGRSDWTPSLSAQRNRTSLYEKRVQWADGFVLVYSICDRASFNAVTKLIQFIKDNLGMDKVPIVIVGNKDLNHRQTVLSEEGRLLALTTACQFYEVTAAENYHSILMVFHRLIDRILASKSSIKRPAGIKGIVKSMSAVFTRK